MNRILHILTKENDSFAADVIRLQGEEAGGEVTVVDLTQPAPDYPGLLRKIFDADSVAVW